MPDHQDLYNRVSTNAFDIGRIYSYNKKTKVPLGDILITARLAIYNDKYLFITLDKEDYSSLLFDRIDILTFEKFTYQDEILEVAQLLRFNPKKYKNELNRLPKFPFQDRQ